MKNGGWIMTAGQLELIGSGEPILNVGQFESLRGNIYESMWATSSLSEVRSPFSTLANAKASIRMLIGYRGPTRAYRKR